MDNSQTSTRVGDTPFVGIGILNGYEVKCNKRSRDGSGKANIVTNAGLYVEGVVFEFSDDQMNLMDGNEKGYHRESVQLILGSSEVTAITYVADENRVDDRLTPTKEYLERILKGARQFKLSVEYQKRLLRLGLNAEHAGV